MILEELTGHGADITDLSNTEVRRRINDMDLGPIGYKLMHPDEGDGWKMDDVVRVESAYRDFLYISVTQPESIVPTKEIDQYWHAHILDTAKYAVDCDSSFGFFLHHFPYLGIRGEDDEENLKRAFERTKEIFRSTLGIEYGVGPNSAASDCEDCTNCIRTCGVGTTELRPSIYK